MHIVYISREFGDSKRGGGIATYIQQIGEGLAALGHRVTVLAASDDTRKESISKQGNLTVHYLSGGDFFLPQVEPGFFLKKFRLFYRFTSYRKKLAAVLASLGPIDLIEVQEFGAESLYLHPAQAPIILRLQTPSLLDRKTQGLKPLQWKTIPDWFVGHYEHRLMRQASMVSACSHALKNWAIQHVMDKTKAVEVIYNPIDLSKWKFNRQPDSLHTFDIMYAGTVSQEKGVEDLLNAVITLRNKGFHVSLTIAGKLGTFGEQLKARALEQQLDFCKFLGHVTKNELRSLYEQAAIACFPSWWEAMGLVCVEAMYSGALVVGSKQGGMAEIIEDGVDGFLMEPKNSDTLADRLLQVYQLSAEEKRNISCKAIEKVQKVYSLESLVAQQLSFYQQVVTNVNKR